MSATRATTEVLLGRVSVTHYVNIHDQKNFWSTLAVTKEKVWFDPVSVNLKELGHDVDVNLTLGMSKEDWYLIHVAGHGKPGLPKLWLQIKVSTLDRYGAVAQGYQYPNGYGKNRYKTFKDWSSCQFEWPSDKNWSWSIDSLPALPEGCQSTLKLQFKMTVISTTSMGMKLDLADTEQGGIDKRDQLAQDLGNLLKVGAHSDVNISCGGQSLPCHKAILAARSTVFEAMLAQGSGTGNNDAGPASNFEEGGSGEIAVEDVNPKALEKFLHFLYTGDIDEKELTDYEIFYAADKYNIKDLLKKCEDAIANGIKVQNAAEVLLLGVR